MVAYRKAVKFGDPISPIRATSLLSATNIRAFGSARVEKESENARRD
jgi:hypothetical protein